jgi:hypothetical protein
MTMPPLYRSGAFLEETGRRLSIMKPDLALLTIQELRGTTSIFHWEYLSQCLMETMDDTGTSVTGSITSDNTWSKLETDDLEEETSPITSRPPDLQPGHPWYNARVTNLMEATEELPNCDEIRR